MYDRLLKLPINGSSSVLLLGPRGTGKTIWAKTHLQDALYLDLLDFNLYKDLLSNPAHLENYIPKDFNLNNWIIIDEVQKAPLLLNEVHRLIESRHLKFLLTGSSARSLKRKGVNLLAGRALRYNMHPFTLQELGNDFVFDHVLKYGLLPKTITDADPRKYLETYVQTYLREEVLQEGLTRNIGAFARFLEVASFSQGSLLNCTEISREVGINRHSINDYFSILEDLLLAYRISPFTRRMKRKMIMHAKFYIFDVGVYRALRPQGLLDSEAELDGVALETLFLQSLLAINDYYALDYKVYFWRISTGLEVDFVVYGPNGFHAFEIKRTENITPKALRSLLAFSKIYPEAKLHLLYQGKYQQYHGNINIMPMRMVLENLPQLLATDFTPS